MLLEPPSLWAVSRQPEPTTAGRVHTAAPVSPRGNIGFDSFFLKSALLRYNLQTMRSIFSKTQLLVSLIFSIVCLCSSSLISALVFIITLLLSTLGLTCSFFKLLEVKV